MTQPRELAPEGPFSDGDRPKVPQALPTPPRGKPPSGAASFGRRGHAWKDCDP